VAVFGNLTEFPLLEVVGMLERRCGVLRFEKIGHYSSLEFHLNNAQLQGLVIDGKIMRDGFAAKNLLLEVANVREGQFEFQRLPLHSEAMLNDLAISVNEVLLRRAALDDEWENFRENLPDVETRFIVATQDLVWLDDELQAFWNQAEPFLEYGISTSDMAKRLTLDIRLVQVNLYKLRTAGIIRPARRVQEVADIRAGNFPGQRQSTWSPLQKPASAPTLAATPTSTATTIIPPVAPPATPAPAKPSLVSRLLGALRFFGKPA
jgi:hypothetical protein